MIAFKILISIIVGILIFTTQGFISDFVENTDFLILPYIIIWVSYFQLMAFNPKWYK